MFLMSQGAHLEDTKSRSVNAVGQVKEPEKSEAHCWRCGEVSHMKEAAQRTVDTSISKH